MLQNIVINNFKSLKNLIIDCSKINIFIGEPNTGKSNILESIGLISSLYHGKLPDFIRLDNMSNLYYNQDIDSIINMIFEFDKYKLDIEIYFENGRHIGDMIHKKKDEKADLFKTEIFKFDTSGQGFTMRDNLFKQFKYYKFNERQWYKNQDTEFLNPPFGNNLNAIIRTRNNIRNIVSDIYNKFEYRTIIEMPESELKIFKDLKDVIISFPYFLTSDTLQRIVFYLAAIKSNKNSILTFEEPESHAFPYYTRYLAESISLNKNNNQYFISTHNPYFLISILEKTDKDKIAVFVTYIKDYITKVKRLKNNDIEDILNNVIDPFMNIDKYIEE